MESPIEIEAPNEVESDYEDDSTNNFYNTDGNILNKRVESADSGACIQSDSSCLLNPYKKLTMKDLKKSKAQKTNHKKPFEDAKRFGSYNSTILASSDMNMLASKLSSHSMLKASVGVKRSSNREVTYKQLTDRVTSLVEENNANLETLRETEDKLEYSEDQLVQKNEEVFNLSKMLEDEKQKVNYLKNLEKRMRVLENDKKLSDDKNVRLEKENEKFLETQNDLSAENTMLKTKLVEAVESVKTLEQTQSLKKGEAKKMVAVANAKIVVLKQQLDANEKHTKELEKKICSMEKVLGEQKEEIESSHSECEAVQKEQMIQLEKFKVAQQYIEDVQSESSENLKKLKEAQKENEVLKRQAEEDAKNEMALIEERQELKDKLKLCTNFLKMQESKIEDYESKINDLVGNKKIFSDIQIDPIDGLSASEALSSISLCLARREARMERIEEECRDREEVQHRNEVLESEVRDLRREMKTSKMKISEMEALNLAVQKSNMELNEKTTELRQQSHMLQLENESLESRLNERTSELVEHKGSTQAIQGYEEELNNKFSQIHALNQEINVLKNEKEELAGKITKLDCELQQQRTNAENCNQKFITSEAKYRNKVEELTVELEITAKTNLELQKKAEANASNYRSDNEQLHVKCGRMGEEVEKCLNEIESLQNELYSCKTEHVQICKEHEETVRNLQQQNATESKKVEMMKNEMMMCKNKLGSHVQHVENVQEQFHKNIEEKNNKINELETKMQICTSSLEEETNCKVQLEQSLEERIKVIKQLNDRVIALEENKQSLAVELSVLREKLQSSTEVSNKYVEESRKSVFDMQQKLHDKKKLVDQLINKLEASEGHVKSLRRELSNHQEEISHNKVESCESNMYIEKLEAEIQETRKQLHLKIEEGELLKSQVTKSDKTKNELNNRCKTLEEDKRILDGDHQEMQRKYELLSERSQTSVTVLSERTNELTCLQDKNRKIMQSLEGKNKELYELKIKVDEQQYQLQVRNEKMETLNNQVLEFKEGKENLVLSLTTKIEQMKENFTSKLDKVESVELELKETRELMREQRVQLENEVKNAVQLKCKMSEKDQIIEELEDAKKNMLEKESEFSQKLESSKKKTIESDERVKNCKRQLDVLYSQLNQIKMESVKMSASLEDKNEQIYVLEAQLAETKSKKQKLEKKLKEEMNLRKKEQMKLKVMQQSEMGEMKENDVMQAMSNQKLMRKWKKSSSSVCSEDVSPFIESLRSELHEKNCQVDQAVSKMKAQESAVVAMREQIKRLQDAVAEKSLSASCGVLTAVEDDDEDCWSTADSSSPDRNSLFERIFAPIESNSEFYETTIDEDDV